jgi:hypothetical protein
MARQQGGNFKGSKHQRSKKTNNGKNTGWGYFTLVTF